MNNKLTSKLSSKRWFQGLSPFLVFFLFSGTTQADTLKNEVNQFIESHPKITTAKQNLNNAGIDVSVAKANYMPILSVNGDIGDQDYEDSASGIDSSLNNNRYSIEITQNIFRGFRDQTAQHKALLKETIAIKNYEKTYQQVLFDATKAYLDVLHYNQAQEISQKKVELLERYSQLIEKAKNSGSKSDVDVYDAQLSLQQALSQQADIDGKYLSATGNFQSVFGHSNNVSSMSLPAIDSQLIPQNLDAALEQANNQSISITLAQSNIEMAEFEKSSIKSELWPSFDLVGSYSEEKNKEGVKGRTKDTRIYLRVEWKYNLGNQSLKKVQSASGKITKERYKYEAVKQDVEQKVRLAWQKHAALLNRSKIAQKTLNIANKVYQARKDLKAKGKGSSIAVINAKVKLMDATITQTNANYESLKASYALAKEVGNIQAMMQ